MKKAIDALFEAQEKQKNILSAIEHSIKTLQELCNHEKDGRSAFEFEGNDHTHKYYKCSICRKIESR